MSANEGLQSSTGESSDGKVRGDCSFLSRDVLVGADDVHSTCTDMTDLSPLEVHQLTQVCTDTKAPLLKLEAANNSLMIHRIYWTSLRRSVR